jgi:hypothetical protein
MKKTALTDEHEFKRKRVRTWRLLEQPDTIVMAEDVDEVDSEAEVAEEVTGVAHKIKTNHVNNRIKCKTLKRVFCVLLKKAFGNSSCTFVVLDFTTHHIYQDFIARSD